MNDYNENSADVPYTSIYSTNSTVHSIPANSADVSANSTIFSVTVPVHDANSGSSEMRGKYA